MPPIACERLHGLDALRGFALLLGIALHATMSYLPGAKYFWIVADSESSTSLGIAFFVIHSFRMTLFFVLAGFFGRLALDRLGLKSFAKDRLRRIVLPLLIFWPIVFPLIVAVIVWAAWLAHGGELPKESSPGPRFTADDFPLAHLWFLYVLSWFYVAAAAMRVLLNHIDRSGRLRAAILRCVRLALGPLAPFLLAIPVAIALATRDGWLLWFGIPTPDQSLYPNLVAVVAYASAFAVGWLLRGEMDLLQGWQRRWLFNAVLAIAATALCLLLIGATPAATISTHSMRDYIFAGLYALASWAWTLALIGFTLRFLSSFSPVRRYLADASYWMYLMHVPLVMALQVVASRMKWPWFIEYPLLLGGSIAVLLLIYQLMVRDSFVGVLLNGKRHRAQLARPAFSRVRQV